MKLPKRFSLRSFMALVMLAAVWFAYQARQESHRRKLVSSIEREGGSVTGNVTSVFTLFPNRNITSVAIPYWSLDEFSDADLAALVSLDEIVVLDFQCKFPENHKPTGVLAVFAGSNGYTTERLAVSPSATELLAKIRDRQIPISLEELHAAHPNMR